MMGGVGEVHGTAEAVAQTVFAPVNFSHDVAHRRAQNNWITMAAIARHHQIFRIARRKRAHDAGFGPVAEMRMSADDSRVLDEGPFDCLFELPDSYHLRVDPDEPVFSELPIF